MINLGATTRPIPPWPAPHSPRFSAKWPHASADLVKGAGFLMAVMLILGLFPKPSEAIPAFARKYNLSCSSCHTKPPRLNAFGEAFHMAGFQIPMTEEGEIKGKRKIGRVFMDSDFLNIFSARIHGNFVEYVSGSEPSEVNIAFPNEVEIYLSGTATQNISYFFELENKLREIEGNDQGGFESKSQFGLGKEFFLMINLRSLIADMTGRQKAMDSGHGRGIEKRGIMVMGPMLMIGKIDPSTNFSYPTNRQFVLDIPGRVDAGGLKRFGITPYAFASKFFGLRTADGAALEVTRESLYNSTGSVGADLHLMVGDIMLQAGLMQGLAAGPTDVDQKKDPYLMARLNFGGDRHLSGSFSGLVYWGNETARVPQTSPADTNTAPVDWLRFGLAGNVKYRLFDLYGAVIWDRLDDLPGQTLGVFDDEAFGYTVETDYLASDRLLLSLRYDQLNAGGFLSQRANGTVVTVQSRYYLRDNLSFYVRDSYNLKGKNSANPLQSFSNLIAFGVDLDF